MFGKLRPKTCAAVLFVLGTALTLALAWTLAGRYGVETVLVPVTKQVGAAATQPMEMFSPLRAAAVGAGVAIAGTALSYLAAELYCAMLEFFRGE